MIKQIALINSCIISVLITCTISAIYIVCAASKVKYSYGVHYDSSLSLAAQEAISVCLENLWPVYGQEPSALWAQLQSAFPFLSHCTIAYTPYLHALCTLQVQKPLVVINKQKIITDQGLLLDSPYTVDNNIPSIIVEETIEESFGTNYKVQPLFLQWITSLDSCLYEQFDIRWKNKTCIVLIEKKEVTAAIVCHAQQSITPALLQAYEHIKSIQKKGVKWQADVRFKDLIIVGERE